MAPPLPCLPSKSSVHELLRALHDFPVDSLPFFSAHSKHLFDPPVGEKI